MAPIRVGLRFQRRDQQRLEAMADRVRRGEIPGDITTFSSAADAARTGEPLIVYCEKPAEAHLMADLYVRLGISRPAVEELTGMRPSN
jgi:hypothetical protein